MNLPKNPTLLTPSNPLEKLLRGLEATEELHYFSFISKELGFKVSTDWPRTTAQISEDIQKPSSIRPNVTMANLEKLIDEVIIASDHSYRIYSADVSSITAINNIPNNVKNTDFNTTLASLYPGKLDSSASITDGASLVAIKMLDAGTAFIFSYVYTTASFDKKSQTLSREKKQYFNNVFIPKGKNRIEVRVSNKINK